MTSKDFDLLRYGLIVYDSYTTLYSITLSLGLLFRALQLIAIPSVCLLSHAGIVNKGIKLKITRSLLSDSRSSGKL